MTGIHSHSYAAALALCAGVALGPTIVAQEQWQPIEPERLLRIDTTKGRILVEMRPDLAPGAVARISRLAREGVYDGLQFHRVVEHFVAQTGNPNNREGGVSSYPNLAPEFSLRLNTRRLAPLASTTSDGQQGFLGSIPIQGELTRGRTDETFRAWGAYCTGVAGMGRQAARDSANSEIFFMLEPARSLDHEYTVWGRIVDGLPVLKALEVGEPPARPDVMVKVTLVADLPADSRPRVSINTPALSLEIQRLRARLGADFTLCDVSVPVRIE